MNKIVHYYKDIIDRFEFTALPEVDFDVSECVKM